MERSSLIEVLEDELRKKCFIADKIDVDALLKTDVIGFDLDHTLALYKVDEVMKLAYSSLSNYLINFKNYSREILEYQTDEENQNNDSFQFNFRPDFVHQYTLRESVVDLACGNVLKLNKNNKVLKAFHGLKELSEDEIIRIYGTEMKFPEVDFNSKGNDKYKLILLMVELPIVPLFLIGVHLFDAKRLKRSDDDTQVENYLTLYNDIIEALVWNFYLYDSKTETPKKLETTGYFYPEMVKHPNKLLHDYSCKELLLHLKSKGLKLFFVSNGIFDYSDFIMRNTLGENYMDYFDFGFIFSQKPGFFHQTKDQPAYFFDLIQADNKSLNGAFTEKDIKDDQIFEKLLKDKRILEGNYKFVEEIFKKIIEKEKLNFLFVGDNFYADIQRTSKLENWKCIAVNDTAKTNFIGSHPDNFEKIWEIENESTFFSHFIQEHTLFTLSNAETLKYLN